MSEAHILIVEDDEDLADALALALQGSGYTVTHTVTREAALELATQNPPDLAIFDVMLKRIDDGIQLTHEFRADEKLCNVPIIMLTAINQATDFNLDKETDEGYLPVDLFLEKPVDPQDLLDETVRLLREGGGSLGDIGR
ncbi:MAG: response regulator [Candidatus Brocadiia bacterium]